MNELNYLIILLTLTVNFIYQTHAFRVFYVDGIETILALESEDIKIECKTDMPMAYCGFIHPSGKRYSFSGSSLHAGNCAVQIKATHTDSGEWRCHVGKKEGPGVEIMQVINVRVVSQLAAVQQNITALHGKEVTLACATTKGLIPLSYCRFEPPIGKPFSIDSAVKLTNPILNRYYFPSNKSLDRGDCAVTIRKVKYEDVGKWTCGAGFDGKEHIDGIMLEVEGLYTMSTASATGITFGAIGIAAFLVILGFVAWKKRRFLGGRRQTNNEEAEAHEMGHLGQPERSPQPPRRGPQVVVESPSDCDTPS